MSSIKFLIDMEANSARLVTEAQKASKALKGIEDSSEKMKKSLSLISASSIVSLGKDAFHAGEQVYAFARSIATSANEIKRQAEIMGLPTDAYQKLSYAAKMADVTNEKFGLGMKFLARSIEEAKAGTGDAGKYFKALGIDVDKLSDEELKLENMTYRLADAFQSVEQGTGKTATAIGLMGRSGHNLVPYFNLGAKAIKDLGEEAVKLGTVLGDVVIEKGSEAEQVFKQLDAQVNALKISLAPGVKGLAEMLQSVFAVDIKKSWEKMKKDFQDMLKDWGEGHLFPIKEILTKAVFEADEGMAELKKVIDPKQFADPEGIKRAKDLMHEWLSGYRVDIDELNDSMSVLGTKSTQSLMVGIKDAEHAISSITAKFNAGKISILDYANAIKAMTEQYNKLSGGDTFNKLDEAQEAYQEKVKQLNEQFPDRGQEYQKTLSKAIDAWLKVKSEIEDKDPAFIRANLSKWEDDLNLAAELYRTKFLSQIPAVDLSGGGTSKSMATAPPVGQYGGWDADLKNKLATIPANVEFTGSGLSPVMPLGDALNKLDTKVGSIQSQMGAMNFAVSFTGVSNFKGEVEKLTNVFKNWQQVSWGLGAYASAETKLFGFDPHEREKLFSQMNTSLNEMYNAGLSNLNNFLANTGREITESLWQRFILGPLYSSGYPAELLSSFIGSMPTTFQDIQSGYASFQSGGMIPKTGLYQLHEGERVISKHNVDMGGITINVPPGTSKEQVRTIIGELKRALKYKTVDFN